MKLHSIYRSAPGENPKNRPSFYSKALALDSFLGAVSSGPAGDRVFINDGVLSEERVAKMSGAEVKTLSGIGNARSYRACISHVDSSSWDDNDYVCFSEDDYLYTPHAFTAWSEVAEARKDVDYFTLYDHPDYGSLLRHKMYMARNRRSETVGLTNWRPVQSTCLSFIARVGAIREDSWMHYLFSRTNTPRDYALWATVVGSNPGFLLSRAVKIAPPPTARAIASGIAKRRRLYPSRTLMAPSPSLATHLESAYLASGRDWEAVARAVSTE